ncbi:MAG: EAL domain-containing response regulator [Pseudomonadales bacterium]|nr:EAL domain-containing response regulator [Pseudomonadales bacterium]
MTARATRLRARREHADVMERNCLLVIDDERSICEFIADVATDVGYEVATCQSFASLEATLTEARPTLLLLDLNMPAGDGVEVLRYLRDAQCRTPVMLTSGEGTRVLETAVRLGRELGLEMLGFLEKPIGIDTLETMLYRQRRGGPVVDRDMLIEVLGQNQLSVLFRPRIERDDDGTWALTGVEAFGRWTHARFGTLDHLALNQIAEANDLTSRLTDALVARAATTVARIRNQSEVPLSLAVDLPTRQLVDVALPDRTAAIIQRAGLPTSAVTLEVTERSILDDPTRATDVLTRCRLKGFGIAMDHFGTGFSSLTQLALMPFSEIKIDGSFIASAEDEDSSRVILRSCIALADALGIDLCVDGVTTHTQLELLDRLGCRRIQGDLVSPLVSEQGLAMLVETFRYKAA